MSVDPISFSIVGRSLMAICREMAANMRRAAYSSVVREARDFSVALLDTRGDVVAQAEMIPMQTGGISQAFAALANRVSMEDLTPDDALLVNDPYQGGQHLEDIFLFTPLLIDGKLLGFAASVAHHVDIGGAEPGLNVHATEFYQEGLRLPLARFSISKDWGSGFVEQILRANTRVPEKFLGDLNAQFAANAIALERLREICAKYGNELTLKVMRELQDYAERRMREGIQQIPDGVYRGSAIVEGRPWSLDSIRIVTTVRVDGTDVHVDFTGTDDQVNANINCPSASAVSAVHTAVKGIIDEEDIPFNAGCERPITVELPYGSVLNPRPPAAVRSRMSAASRAFNAVVGAFSQAVPERVIAPGFDTTTGVALSYLKPDTRTYDVVIEVLGGGWGAGAENDGADAVDNPLSNCANAPVEALEIDHDHFWVSSYSLRSNSGGGGTYRGGLGFERVYVAAKDGVAFAAYSDHHDQGASGLFGGEPGATGEFVLRRVDGYEERLPCATSAVLNQGDSIIIRTGGGGGYGVPELRDPKLTYQDVVTGRIISSQAAHDIGEMYSDQQRSR